MSLLVATWTGVLATVGLLVGAGITAWYARKAFREQSQEVALLQEQVKNQQSDRSWQVHSPQLKTKDPRPKAG